MRVERLFGRSWPSTTKSTSAPLGAGPTLAIKSMSENDRSASSDHDAVRRSR